MTDKVTIEDINKLVKHFKRYYSEEDKVKSEFYVIEKQVKRILGILVIHPNEVYSKEAIIHEMMGYCLGIGKGMNYNEPKSVNRDNGTNYPETAVIMSFIVNDTIQKLWKDGVDLNVFVHEL